MSTVWFFVTFDRHLDLCYYIRYIRLGMVPGLKPPAYAKGYGEATEENVKKLVFSIIAVLLIAISAFAATEDETAVAKVLETFAAKAAERDSRGMANLFVEDGVMKYFYGTVNEPKIAEGRMKIYIVFSFGNVTGYKVPKQIVFRDSLPMTPVGKILRRELRDIA